MVEKSDNLLVESRCALCGFRIVGSASKTLKEDEAEHAQRCPKRKRWVKARGKA